MPEPGSLEDKEAHDRWLYGTVPCVCRQDYKPLGMFQGVNMGKGWVRITTEPDCPHHGEEAERIYKETGHWPRPGKRIVFPDPIDRPQIIV